MSQATEPDTSANDATKSSSDRWMARRSRGISGTPTRRGKKRGAPSPSPSASPAFLLRPSRPPPPKFISMSPSLTSGSKSAPIEISSDESEQGLDAPTAQTTPNLTPAPNEKQLKTLPKKSHRVRPFSKSRRVSAPPTLTDTGGGGGSDMGPRRAQDIDGDIEKQIRNPSRPNNKNKKLGYVYVMPAVHADGQALIKIGFTAGPVDTRKRSIIGAHCKATVQLLPTSSSSPEDTRVRLFYGQVERLAHHELDNFRFEFACGCGTQHREFFAVNETIGHRVVERWARFCALRPFTREGTLTGEWLFHLDRFGWRNHDRPPRGEQREEIDDHDGRHRRWESFLASKRSDWFVHRAGVLRSKLWTHLWQLWSLTLAFLLFASTLSWSSFVLLVATAGSICGEESMRDLVVDLASLLREVAAHYLKTTTTAADEVEEVEEIEEVEVLEETDSRGGKLDIWDNSESGDGEQGTKREDGGGEEDKENEDASADEPLADSSENQGRS
jgi:hypothetical protein